MVLMTQVIEHLWNPNQVLKNIHKVLKKGGYLLIETPNPECFCRLVQGRVFWGGWHRPRHLNIFTKNSMFNLAEANGYEVFSYKQITVPAFWIMGIRNYLGIQTKDNSTFFSRLFSLKSVWALSIFTFIEYLSGIFFLGQSNHQFIFIKKT
jgi:SAM-dependent methyltransferase